MEIRKYDESWRQKWDAFILASENGMFQFLRSFLDYHGDKFLDHSLLFIVENRLVACLPGHQIEDTFHAHEGLSFGGIITNVKEISILREMVFLLEKHLIENQFKNLNIRLLPAYLHPKNETINYLFVENGASLTGFRLTMLVDLRLPIHFAGITKRILKNYAGINVQIKLTTDLPTFYDQMSLCLQNKYQVSPLHSFAELTHLNHIFPENVECWEVVVDGVFAGGCVLFIDRNWVKLQYLFSMESNVSRILLVQLFEIKKDYKYFDLGTSNSLENGFLNAGNHQFKRSLGGRPKLLYQLNKAL